MTTIHDAELDAMTDEERIQMRTLRLGLATARHISPDQLDVTYGELLAVTRAFTRPSGTLKEGREALESLLLVPGFANMTVERFRNFMTACVALSQKGKTLAVGNHHNEHLEGHRMDVMRSLSEPIVPLPTANVPFHERVQWGNDDPAAAAHRKAKKARKSQRQAWRR